MKWAKFMMSKFKDVLKFQKAVTKYFDFWIILKHMISSEMTKPQNYSQFCEYSEGRQGYFLNYPDGR